MGKKILIVDDNEQILEMYKTKFEREGFEVAVELNGLSGFNSAKKIKPDVIVLDIMMPILDGLESLSLIRSQKNICPIVIILSNLTKGKYIKKGLEIGADDYLSKIDHTPSDVLKKAMELLRKNKNK